MYTEKINSKEMEYIKIENDINWNPRYYIPLTALLQYFTDDMKLNDMINHINKKRKTLKIYRWKKYWYGYTICSYSLENDLSLEIENIFIN